MDYPLVAKIVSPHQLVAVGESTHGTHEFFDFKTQLLKELLKKHGFNTLLLEDSADSCLKINKYIQTGSGDLSQLMNGLYPIWRVEELKSLIEWLRDNNKAYRVQFIGFDINQNKENIKIRDELMAKNIFDYVKTYPNTKAFVWAHNTHIKYSGHSKDEKPMGLFLRKWFGRDYFAVAQFFGYGTLSATIIDEVNPDRFNRSLSPIVVSSIPENFLESKLRKIDDKPYYLSDIGIAAFEELNKTYSCRCFGWGLLLSQIDKQTEKINPTRDFSLLTYFPEATRSQPLI